MGRPVEGEVRKPLLIVLLVLLTPCGLFAGLLAYVGVDLLRKSGRDPAATVITMLGAVTLTAILQASWAIVGSLRGRPPAHAIPWQTPLCLAIVIGLPLFAIGLAQHSQSAINVAVMGGGFFGLAAFVLRSLQRE